MAGDITQAAVVQAAIRLRGSAPDGLANVAGIMDGFLPIAEVDDETWDHRVMAVNVARR
ncbi:hypothetical protein ACRAWD_27480 [Caulobacter segnis]